MCPDISCCVRNGFYKRFVLFKYCLLYPQMAYVRCSYDKGFIDTEKKYWTKRNINSSWCIVYFYVDKNQLQLQLSQRLLNFVFYRLILKNGAKFILIC